MASSIILFLCVSASLCMSTAQLVLDSDGEPLFNGGSYYLIPQTIGFSGGLTITSIPDEPYCPYYITTDKDETSPGLPVIISTPLRITTISESTPIVSFTFTDVLTICIQTLTWHVKESFIEQRYIVAGATDFDQTYVFSINKEGHKGNTYTISYGNAGLGLLSNGLLAASFNNPLTVVFKKVPKGTTPSLISSVV